MAIQCPKCGKYCDAIFSRYIEKNGRRIYPKKAKCFVFPDCRC